jgi:arsenate reductase
MLEEIKPSKFFQTSIYNYFVLLPNLFTIYPNKDFTKAINMTVTIYHNPRCGKSRNTLEILKSRGIQPKIIEYLKIKLTEDKINNLLKKLNLEAKDIIRAKEAKELSINVDKMSQRDLIKAISENSIIIERPIVVNNNKAIISRPPERVIEIL